MTKSTIMLMVLSGITITALLLPESVALYSIPPTPAFKFVNNTSTSIQADNSSSTLFLTAGENMTLTYYPANNTIRFSAAGGGGGGGEVFTWTANHDTGGFNLTDGTDAILWTDSNDDWNMDTQRFIVRYPVDGLTNLKIESYEDDTGGAQGQIAFVGRDSAGAGETYSFIRTWIDDSTAANPDGSMNFVLVEGGTLKSYFGMLSDSTAGLQKTYVPRSTFFCFDGIDTTGLPSADCHEALYSGTDNVLSFYAGSNVIFNINNNQLVVNKEIDMNDNFIAELAHTQYNIKTDATRGTCAGAQEGKVLYNGDDNNLNICDGTNWILPNGTAT